MPRLFQLVVASVLFTSGAMAADISPLAAGKPAGVHAAQSDWNISPLVYFGAVAVGIGVALAVTNNNNHGTAAGSGGSSSVSSTSTTG